jgi:hypothetical protein
MLTDVSCCNHTPQSVSGVRFHAAFFHFVVFGFEGSEICYAVVRNDEVQIKLLAGSCVT